MSDTIEVEVHILKAMLADWRHLHQLINDMLIYREISEKRIVLIGTLVASISITMMGLAKKVRQ